MLEAMLEGWRGKRVLIVGKPDGLCAFLTAMLEEIGARLMRVGDRPDAQALCRALTVGRIGAVILPEEMTGRDLPERLAATLTLIQEIREAGVPLLLALSDAAVYPSSAGKMNETAAIGGRTREGLEASILQMAILGAARGLTGDAVRTMLIRLTTDGTGKKFTLPEVNERINELLKHSIKSEGVINLFSNVGTEFSLFDPKFLEEVANMKEKNLAVELLKKLIAELGL